MPSQATAVQIIQQAAARHRIDPSLLWGVYGAETNFGRNVRPSTAGAQGPFQFMPATARSLGVDPLNFQQAAEGAARYLAQFRGRGVKGMLAAYNAGPAGDPGNPETAAYVPKVLELAKTWKGGGGGQALFDAAGAPAASSSGAVSQGSAAASLLAQLGMQRQPPPSGMLAAPTFAAQAALPQGYQSPARGGGPAARPDISQLLAAAQTIGGGVPGSSSQAVAGGAVTGAGSPGQGAGRVAVDSHADRAGVHTQQQVIDFAQRVSAIAGTPVRIGTGTNHSRLTVNGNVSDHWAGNAADIPASGARLVRLGQAALIAAGMDPAKARQQTGGLFNVGGAQIIFNTSEGGDHTTHLHIRPPRRR